MQTKLTDKKYFNLVYAFILNAVVMAVFLMIFNFKYELPDDLVYSQLLADEAYDFHFMNYILCVLFGTVQKVIFPFTAYVFVSLFFSFCAFVAISKVFLDRFNLAVATGIILVLNGFFAVNHYETIAFTKMAGLLSVAGFLCLIHYSQKNKWKTGIIVGGILILLGSMYRFEIFEVSVAVAFFFVLGKSFADYFTVEKGERKAGDFFKILFEKKRLISVIVIVALCFSAQFVSTKITTSTEELSYFTEYTKARSAVYDYEIPPYDECKEEYDKIGIDENDMKMLKNGYMDDEGALTLENLKAMKTIQDNYEQDGSSYIDTLKLMLVSEAGNIRAVWKNGTVDIRNHGIHAGNKGISYFILLIIFGLFVLMMRKRNYFIPIALLFVAFAFYFYLWLSLKVPYRAVYTILLGLSVYMLYSFAGEQIRPIYQKLYAKYRKTGLCVFLVLSVLLSCAGTYLSHIYLQYVVYFAPSESMEILSEYIENNSDKKYELSRSYGICTYSDNIYTVNKTPTDKNYLRYPCTYYGYPAIKEESRNFGTDNMYSNLLNDNVYFVDDSKKSQVDMMEEYLNKYYADGKVKKEIVDSVDKHIIYKFSK